MKNLRRIQSLILDMDGVLWRDNEPLGDLPFLFNRINALGLRTILATNNSTRTVDQYLDKITGFGVHLQPWQIVTSSQAVANLLSDRFPGGGKVYVVGEQALIDTLRDSGFIYSDSGVLAVIAGMDRSITYQKLQTATRLIRNGAPFIATNPDRTFPTPEGLAPGAGAIIAAIQTAADVKPEIAGKPFPAMYQLAIQRLKTLPEQTLVVGDRPETDIIGGQQLGCKTALVLSGVTNREQANAWMPAPDLVVDHLTQLIDLIEISGKS
jgi:4-nitrophenyl phosphatase